MVGRPHLAILLSHRLRPCQCWVMSPVQVLLRLLGFMLDLLCQVFTTPFQGCYWRDQWIPVPRLTHMNRRRPGGIEFAPVKWN